ncbi:MAG: phytanoyl-CoA dioxygenase family protein [Planctomycetes bacterium]|nr:phytanoyl-CoA dioxygenase family protein [Planctomycetota bacterium]
MALKAEQIQQFKREGYTVAPHLFDAREVAALQADIERLKRLGKLRNVATDGDGKTHSTQKVNLQICPMYRESTLVRALPFVPKVVEAVTSLIGDRVILHLDQCFLKPAKNGAGTSWHQDNAYFKIADPMRGTAMWIAIHDATIANGTMNIIPGMFSEKLEHSRDPHSDHHIRCYPDESKAVPCELKAGGAIFFAYGTPHCTRGNTTEKDRAGLAYHFLHEDFASADMLKEDRDHHPYINGAKCTGGLKEYGVAVAGTWDQEVEAAIAGRELVEAK